MPALLFLISSFVAVYVLQKAIAFWNAIKDIENHPGTRVLFSPMSVPGMILKRIPGLTPGNNSSFEAKHTAFAADGWDIRSSVSMLPKATTFIMVADAAAVKEITSSRSRFPKPVHLYRALTFYGHNIVASEGEEWKKYRKISAPAFSDRNNKLVWEETIKIMNSLFHDVWKDRQSITVDHCVNLTLPIALFVIGVAGFGRGISWAEDDAVPPGYTMTFKDALHILSRDFFIPLLVPKWAMIATKRTRAAGRALVELKKYMSDMIHQRLHAEKLERHDLFSSLLEANSQTLDGSALTEDETTAHTLSFTFGLLALYPDEQEKLYQHIKSVLIDGREPTYEDMGSLTYSNAVFYETLRMFPPVTGIPKVSAEDTVLATGNLNGDFKNVTIPKGAFVTISTPGLHYNPRYWSEPESFQPSRFLKHDWPRDAFLPFSAGPRACLGRKFFETEGIAILTMIVSKYNITVKEEAQFANETFAERKARILSARAGLSLTPIRVPLVFTRR
ncbi:cytochrome P450 [Panaeolus papilionaceus]|nr:cytochrome P450 [Panaeolus papilionaceus]